MENDQHMDILLSWQSRKSHGSRDLKVKPEVNSGYDTPKMQKI